MGKVDDCSFFERFSVIDDENHTFIRVFSGLDSVVADWLFEQPATVRLNRINAVATRFLTVSMAQSIAFLE